MKFIHSNLGFRHRGEVIEITLHGSAANVMLLNSTNFSAYKQGRRYTYHGGLAKKSPVRLAIPSTGTWYAVVDLGGLRGSTRASFRVLPGALPPLKEAPLSSVPSLLLDRTKPTSLPTDNREFDVFVSHATEDKTDVARPLAEHLQQLGLNVWYDEFELKIGSSLRQNIDKGIAKSRFGVIVISHSFIRKGWTGYELDGLVTRSVSGEQQLLPIWHNVSKDEVIAFSPSLADKVARSTSTHTISEIADEIASLIISPVP